MRARVPCILLLALLAAPVGAQVCSPEAAPEISTLFPETVQGLEPEFYRAMSGCVTHMYQGGTPWAVVSIEPNQDAFLGETAAGLVQHYERNAADYLLFQEWPVVRIDQGPLGEEFVTLRGPVRITVLVKDGDGGAGSEALARAFFQAVFERLPCDLGT